MSHRFLKNHARKGTAALPAEMFSWRTRIGSALRRLFRRSSRVDFEAGEPCSFLVDRNRTCGRPSVVAPGLRARRTGREGMILPAQHINACELHRPIA
ncbi:MAG TPA: hypothetical protein VMH90_06730 [Thermoplasmata archaeon]|nr:hypothetical protein [Thermoplasmata archaeon]